MPSPRRLAALLLAFAAAARADAPPDFGRDVLPILSDNCFHCHGQDAKARKADLRLDTKDGAARVIADGELVRRVTSGDDAERMPPPKANRKLTPAQVATLKAWAEAGAPWGKHWAFETPRRPPPPAVADPRPVRNAIDAF